MRPVRSLLLCALCLLAGSALPFSEQATPPVLSAAVRADTPTEVAARQRVETPQQRQERALRDVRRMRQLPPPIARAVAAGDIDVDSLTFDETDQVVVNEPLSDVVRQPAGSKHASHAGIRLGVLILVVALLVAGLRTRRKTPVASETKPTFPPTGNKQFDLDETAR